MHAAPSPGQTGRHQWVGLTGPHPDLLTLGGSGLLALAAAPLVVSTPGWWATTVGPLALMANAVAAWWQAGTHRVVTADSSGIRMQRKARWANHLVGPVGTMPRMPIGPLVGRWCRCDLAGVPIWIHHSQFGKVDDFDHDFLTRFSDR
jgi:hypothetical protein